MKLQTMKLAMPLLGVLLWVLQIHAGIFSDASVLLGLGKGSSVNYISSSEETIGDAPTPFTISQSLEKSDSDLYWRETLPYWRDHDILEVLDQITERDLNGTVEFASNVVGYMKRLEDNLMWSNIKVSDGSPSQGMVISFGPEREAVSKAREGVVAFRATNQLMNIFCDKLPKFQNRKITQQECAKLMSRFNFNDTPLSDICHSLTDPCSAKEYGSPYRNINGSCNNMLRAHRGESFTGYSRLLYAHYLDGVHEIRRSVTKSPLPNPRKIVNKLVKTGSNPTSPKFTLALLQWSQFLEHDLSRPATAVGIHTEYPIECCSQEGGNLSPRYIHPFCAQIQVSDDDTNYGKSGVDCLNFVRSIPAVRGDCSFGAADQINQATHFLDGSQIYGSTARKLKELRTFQGGKLQMSIKDGKSYLPLSSEPHVDCQLLSNRSVCFKSGDPRVNFQPQLALMHTLWYREHNRIAEKLAKLNPHWSDEALFQEARRVVVAEMQKITYVEWLEAVLGKEPQTSLSQLDDYSQKVDPSVSNSFAVAVMRSLKSLSDTPQLYNEERVSIGKQALAMKQCFHNSPILRDAGVLDSLARGLATQKCQKLDIYYAEDLINGLYSNGKFGFDVLSFDIERGRDHGLPSYTAYRQLCGLKPAKTFEDLRDYIPQEHIATLTKLYASPQDVDLIIGGLLENPKDDQSLFGPTFSCIVADQVVRTKKGDRYFYTNQNQPKPFTPAQLNEIEKATLARIICDNGDQIKQMQPKVFKQISDMNTLQLCQSNAIPILDLTPWLDPSPHTVKVKFL